MGEFFVVLLIDIVISLVGAAITVAIFAGCDFAGEYLTHFITWFLLVGCGILVIEGDIL